MLKNVVDYLNYKETARSNVARENETNRHNVVGEQLSSKQLDETIRHNVESEGVSKADLAERNRHNRVEESQGWSNLSQQAPLRAAQGEAALAQAKASTSTSSSS